jgi:hypothetical protein
MYASSTPIANPVAHSRGGISRGGQLTSEALEIPPDLAKACAGKKTARRCFDAFSPFGEAWETGMDCQRQETGNAGQASRSNGRTGREEYPGESMASVPNSPHGRSIAGLTQWGIRSLVD